jgi:predicted AAA+ superfamily ATPase
MKQQNTSNQDTGLQKSGKTVSSYLDVLTDLYMVRQLAPWAGNSRKRLIRSPKVYVRDAGLLHRLAKVPDLDTLLGHPLCGGSWEGFVIENVLALLPDTWQATFYRTSAQAEIDQVLEGPGKRTVAVEIKRTLSPTVGKGFRLACEDVDATDRFYVLPEGDRYPLAHGTEAIGLLDFVAWVAAAF